MKQFCSSDKCNAELPFTSIKQEAERFIYNSNKFGLIYFRKEETSQIHKMCTVIRRTWGMPTTRAYLYSTQIQK